jgi:hypothetical protein
MKRFWIQTMAHNSTNTTTMAMVVASPEIRDQIGQRMAHAAERGHHTRGDAAFPAGCRGPTARRRHARLR